jgi:hypothetical protein
MVKSFLGAELFFVIDAAGADNNILFFSVSPRLCG